MTFGLASGTYGPLVHCARLISMAFLSTEHDKCLWKIKFRGWVSARQTRGNSNILWNVFEVCNCNRSPHAFIVWVLIRGSRAMPVYPTGIKYTGVLVWFAIFGHDVRRSLTHTMPANEPLPCVRPSVPRFIFNKETIFFSGRNQAEIVRDLFKIFVTTSNSRTYDICFREGFRFLCIFLWNQKLKPTAWQKIGNKWCVHVSEARRGSRRTMRGCPAGPRFTPFTHSRGFTRDGGRSIPHGTYIQDACKCACSLSPIMIIST